MELSESSVVKAHLVLMLMLANSLLVGCVSTVSDPAQLTAVVGNANTDPQALKAAKQKVSQQREQGNPLTLSVNDREPKSMSPILESDAMDLTFDDLSPSQQAAPITAPTASSSRESTGVKQVASSPTEDLPSLTGIRLLGLVTAGDGSMRCMVKQQDQAAGIVSIGTQLRVGKLSYQVKGVGADGVVVEDVNGQSFLVRR